MKELSKNFQRSVKELSRTCQGNVKKFQRILKDLSKTCQTVVSLRAGARLSTRRESEPALISANFSFPTRKPQKKNGQLIFTGSMNFGSSDFLEKYYFFMTTCRRLKNRESLWRARTRTRFQVILLLQSDIS